MLNGVIAHISACSAPTGTRNNLQGTRSRARICKIAAPIVRLFSCILALLWKERVLFGEFQTMLTQSAHSVRVGEISRFAHSGRVVKHVSSAKTFLHLVVQHQLALMHYDCAFALIERLPLLVVKCSAISRRVFPALRTHHSLREPLPQFRCHHLAFGDSPALAKSAVYKYTKNTIKRARKRSFYCNVI